MRVLTGAAAQALGGQAVAIQIRRADGGTGTAPVAIRVADASLRGLYGADYAGRLRWYQTPPGSVSGRRTPLASSRQVGVTVLTPRVNSKMTTLTAVAMSTSIAGTGSFAATPLNPAGSWQVSAQTGGFSWRYPLRTPPAPAGPTPGMGLSYSSQSIDGETGSTNNQPSDVGEGWSFTGGGAVSEVYTPCAVSDTSSRSAISGSGDLCFVSENATISFDGQTGALVKNGDGTWKFQGDSAVRVEHLTGTSNGTTAGDYWKLTSTDGTQYFFGLNKLPGWAAGNPTTNSAWTVPVCGNATTACSGTARTATPFSTRAWQWNLDYVVDPHGNAEALYYATDTNHYAEHGTGSVAYTRAGRLTEIDYGLRSSNIHGTNAASDKVVFGYAARCETGQSREPSGACNPASPTASYWPDVPWDQNCTSTTSCSASQISPSFWSTNMLSTVTADVLSGSAYAQVDQWKLSHSWPSPGDGTSAALWMSQVQQTGGTGTSAISTPATVFAGETLQNRVYVWDGLAQLNKYRVNAINTDTGGNISVNYSRPQCSQSLVASLRPQTNTHLCYPQWWTPPALAAHLDWFNKYVVTSVVASPHTGGGVLSVPQTSSYLYTGTAAWRFNQAPGLVDNQRTWSVWAGYSSVEIRTGDPSAPAGEHTTDYTFLQGLDGDPCGPLTSPTSQLRHAGGCAASGSPLQVSASDGTKVTDSAWWAGRVLEKVVHVGASSGSGASTTPTLTDTITVPWASTATASSTRSYTYVDHVNSTTYTGTLTLSAHLTGDATVTTRSTTATGATRTDTVSTTHDGYGRALSVNDATSDAGATCTRTSYADNTGTWMLAYPATVTEVGVACSATPSYPKDAISATATYYDGSTTLGAAPSTGEATQTAVATAYTADGAPTWQSTSVNVYDALGRVTSQTDPRTSPAAVTTTAYTPAATGPLTQTVVTNPIGATTTTYNPAWGAVTSVTDPNGSLTTANYDVLGRRTQVWLPDNTQKSSPSTPSLAYAYTLSTTAPSTVTTTTQLATGGTAFTYSLYDGLGQEVQTQTAAEGGGIDLVDTAYDANGQTVDKTGTYYATGTPSTTLYKPSTTLPSQAETTYDGAGRVTSSGLYANAGEGSPTPADLMWATVTAYPGIDRVDVTPPAGGVPTSTYTDSRRHTTSLVQYLTPTITGMSPSETTQYSYDPRGDMTGMKDPAGNLWSWTYNVLGQKTSASDPDTGTSNYSYDPAGDLQTSTDADGNSLTYTYDNSHRRTGEYAGTSASGVELAAWTYDQATLGKGLPYQSTRYVGGSAGNPGSGTAYSTTIGAYDPLGNPLNRTTTIGGSTPLAGSYTTSYTYGPNGQLQTQTDPAAGGLPSEKLVYGYDSLGNAGGLSALVAGKVNNYVSGITYDHIGQLGEVYQFNTTELWRDYTYNTGSGRVTEVNTTKYTTSGGGVVSDDHYTYDNAGNLLTDQNNASVGAETQCYTYDALRNLGQAWTPASNTCTAPTTSTTMGGPAPYWETFTADPTTGNRTATTDYAINTSGAVTGSTSSAYSYVDPTTGSTAQPNAVKKITTTQSGSAGSGTTNSAYSYDADGSTTAMPGLTIGYDSEERASTLTLANNASNPQTDIYSADGNLLLQADPTGTTAYLGDTQLHADTSSTPNITGSRSYNVLGATYAERDTTSGVSGSTLYFLDPNPVGTNLSSIADATSTVTHRYQDPYGNPRGTPTTWPSNHAYLDAAQNPLTTSPTAGTDPITQLGARNYDPTLGRFLTADPILDPAQPQSINGYAYANNNPVTNADPTGTHIAVDPGVLVPNPHYNQSQCGSAGMASAC